MQGKIAVEEHFKNDETSGSETRYPGSYWSAIPAKLLDAFDFLTGEPDLVSCGCPVSRLCGELLDNRDAVGGSRKLVLFARSQIREISQLPLGAFRIVDDPLQLLHLLPGVVDTIRRGFEDTASCRLLGALVGICLIAF